LLNPISQRDRSHPKKQRTPLKSVSPSKRLGNRIFSEQVREAAGKAYGVAFGIIAFVDNAYGLYFRLVQGYQEQWRTIGATVQLLTYAACSHGQAFCSISQREEEH